MGPMRRLDATDDLTAAIGIGLRFCHFAGPSPFGTKRPSGADDFGTAAPTRVLAVDGTGWFGAGRAKQVNTPQNFQVTWLA